jgi:hypothetical protein
MFVGMQRVLIAVLVGLGCATACGPGLATSTAPRSVRPGVPPPGDEAGIRTLLAGEVTNGGLWFADAGCQAQFGTAGTIKADAFDAFARCLVTLRLRTTGRSHWHDDTSVLTDDAGFEIEAHIADGRLDFIGFSARAPGMPDLPTITPEALEALRISGDPNATISAEEAKLVLRPGKSGASPTHTEHLRLCLTETGELRTVMPGTTTTPASAAAFSVIARGWRFRPFVVAGKAQPVCAIAAIHYPVGAGAPERHLPQPPQLSKAGNLVYFIHPAELNPLRIVGNINVSPDAEDKSKLHGRRVVGTFRLCLDEAGRYESGTLMRSTGLPRYDAKIARTMMTWEYRPYVVDGKPIPVCTAVTFIYTQG